MNKIAVPFLILYFFLSSLTAFAISTDLTNLVLVSVAPYKFFVEKIAGDTVKVILMVPAGASSHTYEPTPKQVMMAAAADIWFRLGEPFESKAIAAIKSHRPYLKLVDMREGIDLISDSCGHGKKCYDPHIWLSPRLVKTQANRIADVLSETYPENKKMYQERLKLFLQELDQLDSFISETLKPMYPRSILVSHPAYAYFCRDYDLKQFSIEYEGRDPTPKQLTNILIEARENQIHTIFIQEQYSNKGAKLIGEEIKAVLVTLNPYSENYLKSMREIAQEFAKSRTAS